jgi:very-short-patch-repair endonuclease
MSWCGYCTRCGEPTTSTKDPRYWPTETTTGEESAALWSHDHLTSYDPGGESFGVHHRECHDLPDQYWPSGGRITGWPPSWQSRWKTTRRTRPAPTRGAPESPIEQKFREACLRLDTPVLRDLVPQHPVAGYRIDFALPDRKIGIELDGFATHSSTADIEKDRRRQRDLEGRGWYIIRFGGREVHRDADYCAQQAAWLIEHGRKGVTS